MYAPFKNKSFRIIKCGPVASTRCIFMSFILNNFKNESVVSALECAVTSIRGGGWGKTVNLSVVALGSLGTQRSRSSPASRCALQIAYPFALACVQPVVPNGPQNQALSSVRPGRIPIPSERFSSAMDSRPDAASGGRSRPHFFPRRSNCPRRSGIAPGHKCAWRARRCAWLRATQFYSGNLAPRLF